MKLKALIIDDEYPARKELRYLLNQTENVQVVGEASNAKEALRLLPLLDYSVIFLDILMPGMNGIELGQIIQNRPNPPFIVIITAYEQYAVQAFELNAVDYLLKPFDQKRLQEAVQKVMKLHMQRKSQKEEEKREPIKLDRVPVEKQGKTLLLTPDEIVFAYSQDNTNYIRTHRDTFVTRLSLRELEARLDEKRFFRSHRHYIVNLDRVQEIIPFFNGTYTLIVGDSKRSEVPVGRTQAKKLKSLLGI